MGDVQQAWASTTTSTNFTTNFTTNFSTNLTTVQPQTPQSFPPIYILMHSILAVIGATGLVGKSFKNAISAEG